MPIGEDPAAHGHRCTFTDLYHTIPYKPIPYDCGSTLVEIVPLNGSATFEWSRSPNFFMTSSLQLPRHPSARIVCRARISVPRANYPFGTPSLPIPTPLLPCWDDKLVGKARYVGGNEGARGTSLLRTPTPVPTSPHIAPLPPRQCALTPRERAATPNHGQINVCRSPKQTQAVPMSHSAYMVQRGLAAIRTTSGQRKRVESWQAW